VRANNPMEVTEQHIELNGIHLWTARQGQGLPLLLASGGPGCCDYLAPVAALIDDQAHVIRFDQRGCGRSEAPPPYDVAGAVADLEALRAHLGFERWIVGGHSWGANLALAYALDEPERTQALIYLCGNGVQRDLEWRAAYERALSERGEVIPEMACPPNLEVNQQVNQSWRSYIRHPLLFKKIATLDVPALVLCAEQDIRPNWPAMQLAHLLPQAQLVMVEGAEHCMWYSHAAELQVHLRDFLTRLEIPAQSQRP
jgi:proline iminopeptidase